jgi:hypothetical protein
MAIDGSGIMRFTKAAPAGISALAKLLFWFVEDVIASRFVGRAGEISEKFRDTKPVMGHALAPVEIQTKPL